MNKLVACKKCEKVFDRSALEPREVDGSLTLRWDRRPRTLGGARVGWDIPENWGRRTLEPLVVLLCPACRGEQEQPAAPPLWKEARAAWSAAARENPALARFAPRSVRRKL